MTAAARVLFLPGDGIGPEVMEEVRRVIGWFTARGLALEVEDGLVGGAALDAHGTPLDEATLARAVAIGTVMFGAVGVPRHDAQPFHLKPEQGLLRLRKTLGLFANLRPATVFTALAAASSLKAELVAGLDLIIVRELTGGVYFGEPRGIETLADGQERGTDTQVYTTGEIQRVARVAFDLARGRRNKLTSVEKANVMHTGVLWRRTLTALHAAEYPEVTLEHLYADNCAMQLVRQPKQFDVIVTDNLFGDLLSDCAAMLTGSLGMLPSAALGAPDASGRRLAMYEPVHGSAPDIAGQGIANPLACLASFAMLLRWSLQRQDLADLLERAIAAALDDGWRTADIMQPGMRAAGTTAMGDAVLAAMDRAAA